MSGTLRTREESIEDHVLCQLAHAYVPVERASGQARLYQPLIHSAGSVQHGNRPSRAAGVRRVTAIVVLLRTRGPSTVRRIVVALVVDSIERVRVRRSAPHVRDEVLVRAPLSADRDPACPVVLEEPMVRVVAPRQHVRPRAVFWRLLAVRPLSMPQRGFRTHRTPKLGAQAPTGLRAAHPQKFGSHVHLLAACAPATIGWAPSAVVRFLDHRESPVNPANHVDLSHGATVAQ